MGFRKYMGEIVGEIAGGWVFPPRERHKWAEYVFFFFFSGSLYTDLVKSK